MSIFYETQDGIYAGELVEEYDDSFLVKVIYAKGEKVIGNQYSLVKKPNKACSGHRAGAGQPEKPLVNDDAQMSVGAIPTARRR